MLFPVIHKFDSIEKVDFNINVHDDYKSYKNFEIWKFVKILWKLNFFENFEILWKFWICLKISEFSLIDDEVQVFRINIKLLSYPVAELKIREND